MSARYAQLTERGVLALVGPDSRALLQGLVSNDIDPVSPERVVYAALLTPQGKYLFDFFVAQAGGEMLLECERARIPDLVKRLTLYKLRAKVQFEDRSDAIAVHAVFGEGAAAALGLAAAPGSAGPIEGGIAFVDPRLAAAGVRLIGAEGALAGMTAASAEDYDAHRLALGLPDGSRDLLVDKSTLLESNFEELHGVDFGKGCYVGQEVTARTKYRGLVRKRLLPVRVEGPLPAPGTDVLLDGKLAGTMHSGRDGAGLALLRLEQVEKALEAGAALQAGEARLRPVKPDWLAA